jgi:hypothetical protein
MSFLFDRSCLLSPMRDVLSVCLTTFRASVHSMHNGSEVYSDCVIKIMADSRNEYGRKDDDVSFRTIKTTNQR